MLRFNFKKMSVWHAAGKSQQNNITGKRNIARGSSVPRNTARNQERSRKLHHLGVKKTLGGTVGSALVLHESSAFLSRQIRICARKLTTRYNIKDTQVY